MGIKAWVINRLGGVTKDQQETTRSMYEKWAVKHLTGKMGEIAPDCLLYLPFYGDDIIVLRSNIEVSNGVVKGVKIAPWCKNVSIKGVSMCSDTEDKQEIK